MNLEQDYKKLQEQIEKSKIMQDKIIEKAKMSDEINDVYFANQIMKQRFVNQNSEQPKSMLIDPYNFSGAGFREKRSNVSYDIMKNMSRVPIVKSVIETRKEQVCQYSSPQEDKYSKGWVIEKKRILGQREQVKSKEELEEVEELTKFLLDCGDDDNHWSSMNFESFLRSIVQDSLTYDQYNFELVRNDFNVLRSFYPVDASTVRLIDTSNQNEEIINGYYPNIAQIYQSSILNTFYPWEMCFGVRNPDTSIYQAGYGRSELEDLMGTVTDLLNTQAFNSNYFKIGSNPKGILKVTGNVNMSRIDEFRNHWQSQISGVTNAHKMPVIEADKLDFINTQLSNKDMEYARYQEFLIKVVCACYKIDPSEIGFPMQGESGGGKSIFEGSNETRLEHSKNKGLIPIMKNIEKEITKYIVEPKNDKYCFKFKGYGDETAENDLNYDIKQVQYFKTINQILKERGEEEIENGDIILNPAYINYMNSKMQIEMNQELQQQEVGEQVDTTEESAEIEDIDFENDPILKAAQKDIQKLLTKQQ